MVQIKTTSLTPGERMQVPQLFFCTAEDSLTVTWSGCLIKINFLCQRKKSVHGRLRTSPVNSSCVYRLSKN